VAQALAWRHFGMIQPGSVPTPDLF